MIEIRSGDRVLVTTADGEELERTALTGAIEGRDFPVVLVCATEKYREAIAAGREPEGFPWPADYVQPAR